MNDSGKKRKATTAVTVATSATTADLLSVGGLDEDATGIAKKLAEFDAEEQKIQVESDEKIEEMRKLDLEMNGVEAQIKQLGNLAEMDATKKMELINKKDKLKDQIMKLKDQRIELKDQTMKLKDLFTTGEYYAATKEYVGIEEKYTTPTIVEWSEFIRDAATQEKVGPFSCRYCKKGGTTSDIVFNDPYNKTRNEAEKSNTAAPNSDTTRASSLPQSDKEAGRAVWPTDIFGNSPCDKPIAHLLPAGSSKSHKQWLNIACAVVGIKTDDLNIKKKAARGIISADSNTQKNDNFKADAGTQEQRKSARKPLTGVVHFVSNKLRLANQASIFDGAKPSCLIIPVMTLEQAKKWRGGPYKAIYLMGIPEGGCYSALGSSNLYKMVTLNDPEFMRTRDAHEGEVSQAIDLLKQAVLALRDMIARLSNEEIDYADESVKNGPLAQARQEARGSKPYKVPIHIKSKHSDRKPVCLLTFGDSIECGIHPPPDPLLLVLKSANIFGVMAEMKMLANAIINDDEFCEGDLIEMEKYLEAQEQACRSSNWNDLATGLGQPNGYFSSIESDPDN